METREVLETRLRDARAAYHEISIGRGVRTLVDQNGERIEYQMANIGQLSTYIRSLERQLGAVPHRPMGIVL